MKNEQNNFGNAHYKNILLNFFTLFQNTHSSVHMLKNKIHSTVKGIFLHKIPTRQNAMKARTLPNSYFVFVFCFVKKKKSIHII